MFARKARLLKHFINPELLAPNVLTVPLDVDVVNEFVELARSEEPGPDYATVIPWPKLSDMRWISGATPKGFARFQSAYERLGLAGHVREYLDLDEDVRYYTGFLHTRGQCWESNLHVDWQLTNNEAFTMLTPLPGDDRPHRLLYQTMKGETVEYAYKPGEGIIFGDHFTHASPIGTWDPPFTLLAFNFGTDKMEFAATAVCAVGSALA